MLRSVHSYGWRLLLAIFAYRLLNQQVLVHISPWAFTLIMLFLPIFSFLLQRKIEEIQEKPTSVWKHILYSMLMIWMVSILVPISMFLLARLNLTWFFSEAEIERLQEFPSLKIIINHFNWYTIFGFPGVLLARLVLFLKAKYRKV